MSLVLQLLGSVESCTPSIERAQRQMPGFSRYLHKQTVRIAQRLAPSKLIERGSHDLAVLKRQLLMVEQHLDCRRDLGSRSTVNGIEYPGGLRQREQRDPRACRNKSLCRSCLFDIVARDESDKYVCINRAHAGPGPTAECPVSSRLASASGPCDRTRLDECPPSYSARLAARRRQSRARPTPTPNPDPRPVCGERMPARRSGLAPSASNDREAYR